MVDVDRRILLDLDRLVGDVDSVNEALTVWLEEIFLFETHCPIWTNSQIYIIKKKKITSLFNIDGLIILKHIEDFNLIDSLNVSLFENIWIQRN